MTPNVKVQLLFVNIHSSLIMSSGEFDDDNEDIEAEAGQPLLRHRGPRGPYQTDRTSQGAFRPVLDADPRGVKGHSAFVPEQVVETSGKAEAKHPVH